MSLLVAAVLAVFLSTAYREVETTLAKAGGERAASAGRQIADLIERSLRQGVDQLAHLTNDPAVRGFLRDANPPNRDAARAAMLAAFPSGPRRMGLWRGNDDATALEVDVPAPQEWRGGVVLPRLDRPLPPGLSKLKASSPGVYAEISVPINDVPNEGQTGPRLGWFGSRSTFAISPPDIITRLVGEDALVVLANADGSVSADLARLTTMTLPIDLSADRVASYTSQDGERHLGAVVRVGGTPWSVWVEFPYDHVVRPARVFLQRMVVFGAAMAVVALVLIRAFATRITDPLAEMTDAAEAIAHGDYSRRVAVARSDEIGRLGRAFDAMTGEIQTAHGRLEHLAAIVESSDDAIVGMTLDGVVRSWNRGAEQLYGYSASEMVGRPISAIIPADCLEELPTATDRLRRGESIRQYETVRVTKEGARLNVLITLSPIRDPAGTIVGVSKVTRDITERKRLEDQLRQAQKMEAIGQLAGGIAHDFNNLLTAILGYANMVRDNLAADDPRRRDVDEIVRAGDRAAALTRQLLAFGRKQVLQPQLVDLNALITDTSQMLRRLIGEHITLETKLTQDLGLVRADPGQIEQIVINLAINARDAMPDGGRLSIETVNVALDQSYARMHVVVRPGPYVMLAVTDTGLGMDEETKRRAFEPFFTTKERGHGTGLGLATVHGIVEQSGGYVWVYSEVGHGTTFKVYLPQAEGAAAAPRPAVADVPPVGSETVLLVEDEEAVRFLTRALLERAGYQVLECATPAEAEAQFDGRAQSVDLLLTDVIMPGSTGPALFERLAARRPALKVLYMSGYTDDTILRNGVSDRPAAFLEKPFTVDGLLRKVREVLDA
jgi:PAS domain S-box-containing protein